MSIRDSDLESIECEIDCFVKKLSTLEFFKSKRTYSPLEIARDPDEISPIYLWLSNWKTFCQKRIKWPSKLKALN